MGRKKKFITARRQVETLARGYRPPRPPAPSWWHRFLPGQYARRLNRWHKRVEQHYLSVRLASRKVYQAQKHDLA